MSYSPGSALQLNMTELQIIAIQTLLSYLELPMQWELTVLLQSNHFAQLLASQDPWIWPNTTSPGH